MVAVSRSPRSLSARIDEVPEVQSVFVYSDGSDVTEARVMINYGKKETRERSQFVLEEELKNRLSDTPDMRINFQNENGQNDLTINVLGTTEDGAALAAERLAAAMSELPSLESVSTTASLQRPEIQITPRADVAAQLGVSASDMATTLRVATLGDVESNLAKFNAGDEQIPIVVRLNPDARADLMVVQNLRVNSSSGQVPLGAVADVKLSAGATRCRRRCLVRLRLPADRSLPAPGGWATRSPRCASSRRSRANVRRTTWPSSRGSAVRSSGPSGLRWARGPCWSMSCWCCCSTTSSRR